MQCSNVGAACSSCSSFVARALFRLSSARLFQFRIRNVYVTVQRLLRTEWRHSFCRCADRPFLPSAYRAQINRIWGARMRPLSRADSIDANSTACYTIRLTSASERSRRSAPTRAQTHRSIAPQLFRVDSTKCEQWPRQVFPLSSIQALRILRAQRVYTLLWVSNAGRLVCRISIAIYYE